jgi:hypothetical protein
MKQNSHAFTLIKNLTMSEKRYFNLFSERHIGKTNKSKILFKVLDGLKTEDDSVIKEQLKIKDINPTFLSADKNYLYNQILRSLQAFHHSKTEEFLHIEKLLQIKILYEKGLYDLCALEAEKTLKAAEEKENYSLKIELLMWLRRSIGYSKGLLAAYDVNKEIKANNELLRNQIEYTDLYYESLKLRFSGFKARNESRKKLFDQLLKKPLLRDKTKALTLLSKLRYHLVYANYYFVLNEQKKELQHLSITLREMENSGYYHIENPFDYIYVYHAYLQLLKGQDQTVFFDELKRFKQFAWKLRISKEKSEIQIFTFSSLLELNNNLENHKFAQNVQIIPSIEKKLKSFIQLIEPAIQVNLWYLFAYSYFKVKNYKKSLVYINIIQNEYKEADREDIFNLSKVFMLILFYELKKNDLLEYTLPKVTKQLEKKGKLFRTEMLVLDVLQKSIQASTTEKKKYFEELRVKLAEVHSSKFEAPALLLFNFEEWCADK